jgi:alpha-amylase
MCTKYFSDGEVHKYFNPYDTPYEAFINYMNVISDFQIRLDEARAALDINDEIVKEEAPVKRKAVKKK